MAKRTTFDFESFLKLLRRGSPTYIKKHELEELENLWYMNKIDRAFSKAASMYHRLPKHKITEGLQNGIQAFKDAIKEESPRGTSGKRFDPENYIVSPTSPSNFSDSDRHIGSPTSFDRKKRNTDNDLVYYIRRLARGIRKRKFDYIEEVRNLQEMSEGFQDLRWMAYDVEELTRQIEDLEEKNRNNKSLWDSAVDGLSKERDRLHVRFQELERKYSSLKSSHITKVENISRLEKEKKTVNDRYLEMRFEQNTVLLELRDIQHRLQAEEKYSAVLYHKNRELSESFDNLQYQNTNLEERIRKYLTIVERLESEISMLKKKNSPIKHQTDARNILLKRATVYTETMGIYDKKDYDREMPETRESSVSLQKRVDELEAKCCDLGERNTTLINQVQAKKVQLKKATKHAEATNNDIDELQDRLKEAEQRIKQIEQDKRELEEMCTILKERTSGRSESTRSHIGELAKVRAENDDLRARLRTALDIIDQPEKTDTGKKDLVIDDIVVTSRLQEDGDEFDLSTQPDSKIKELECQNVSLRKRLQDALDRNKETEKCEIRYEEHGTDVSGFTNRLSGTRDQTIQLEKVQSKLEEVESEKRNLEERLKAAHAKINQMETDDKKKNETETGNVSFKDRFQYAFHSSPSDVSSSRVRELERENRSLENRLEEAMNRIHELDREVQKGSKDSYKSHSGKNKRKIHEKSDARVKDLERENISLQDSTSKLRRDMGEKDQELQRVTSQLQKAEDDKRDLLIRMKRGSEDSNVLQGSGAHFTSPQGITMRNGEGLREIHREKEKVLQAVNQAKQFEQQNQQLLESQSRLQSQLEEKDQELERLQSELRSHGARNTDQDQDLFFVKPEKEGMLHTESQTRQLEQDKRDLTERNEQLQSQLEQHQREVERLQTELRQRDENRTEQSMTDMHHQTGGESLTERQTERFEQQKENLLDRNRDLQKQIDQLKEEVSRLTREHRQKDDYCTELSRNLTDMRRERDMAGQNDGQIRQLEQEKQELQQRLEEALVDRNKVDELESLVMTLANQKREYEERLGQEQAEEEAGIYSEGAPSKLKRAKKIKTYSGEKLHKDKGHRTEDGEQNELDRVKLELLETKQENEDLKKRLNGLQYVKETQKEGETDPNGPAHTDTDQIDSKMDPQIVSERQENEFSKVKFELQVLKKQKSDLQKRLSNLQAELERVQQKEGRLNRSERVNTDQPDGNGFSKRELEQQKRELEQQTNELDRVKSELEETRKQNEELQQRLEDALSASGKLKESKALLTWQTRVRENLQDGDGDKIVEERIQNVESTPNLTEIPDRHDRNQRLGRESIYGQEDMQRVQSELQKAEENNKNLQERLTLMEQEAEKSQQLENTARRHRRERQELQNRLSDSENTATRLRKERQELRCRNAELEQKNTQSCNELERLSSDLRQSEERNANLSRRLRNADGDSDKVKELEVQVLYLQNEKKQGEERLKRVERETTKREKLETRPKLYGEERGSLPDQSPGLQEQLEKQQIEIARITSELHQTKTEKEELENRLQRLGREMSTTESTVATFRQYEKEKRDTGESNVQLQKLIEEQQTDIQKLNSDLKKSQEESQNLRERLNVAEKKPKKVEELEVQLIYLLNEKKEAEKRTSRLQRKVEQQQAEIQRLHLQLEQVQEQYDDIQTRFSQLASAQLTHDNPNVTDLSDSNRPIKLGDAYSELYDNEWTEAYSALDEDDGNSLQEVEIVMTLRDILLDCFEHCKDTSKKQIDGIKSLLFSPRATSSTVPSGADLTKAQAKMISELRKKTVAQAISSMQQKMTRKYHDRWQYKAVEDFVKKCVELCWPMVVQSPPVFLDGSYKSGDHFDKDVFKAFTKTGTSIDYVVWPPLYLHKGGPILCKGTAQGRK